MRYTSPHGSPPAMPHRWGGVVLAASALMGAMFGCVYDSNQRCGEGQVVYTQGIERCVCADGWAWSETGCVRCGTHEVSSSLGCTCEPGYGRVDATVACTACGENEVTGVDGACACATGYSRPTPDAACTPAPAGIGIDCSSTNPCADSTYSYCQPAGANGGYCTTRDCATTADCAGGYMCELSGTPSYCRRPPLGAGLTCSLDSDCAGTEATYCDTYVTHTCLVQGCTLTPDNCFTGSECCDLTSFGIATPLCIAQGACTT
jgi:hypothetical protein